MTEWRANVLAAPAGALIGGSLGAILGGGVLSAVALATGGALLGAVLSGLAGRPRGSSGPPAPKGAARDDTAPEGKLKVGSGRHLLENVPIGLLLIDRDGRVRLINRVARSLFGGLPPEPFQMSAFRAPRFLEAIERGLAQGAAGTVTFALARAGETLLKATIEPIDRDSERPGVIVMLEDHTAARRAADLHRDFVANASHALKTPLAAVSGLIETLEGHARDDPAATARFLRIMARETGRMSRLVNDLLSLNWIEINERIRPETPQPVWRIAREAIESLRPMADEAGMTLAIERDQDALLVPGDAEELRQLVVNLVENAIRYGEAGSAVEVLARDGGSERPGQTGIAVINQGEGIAHEHIPRLTERFYRVNAGSSHAKGGTGLGLAIVKHILNRHQGGMTIESEPGRGACFTVWLPVAPETAVAEGSPPQP